MPSPFPGMDPYLESDRWNGVHSMFVNQIGWEISEKLPDGYVAFTEERLVVEDFPEDSQRQRAKVQTPPDVSVVRERRVRSRRSSTALLEPPMRVRTAKPLSYPETFLEIRDAEKMRLITSVELLSPTNKGSHRNEYLTKRERALVAEVNLVEIDLLLGGRRLPTEQTLPASNYFVFVCRAAQQTMTDLWPIFLKDSLPKIPIPLKSADGDVVIDLQKIFTRIYDHMRYARSLNYLKPPDAPLSVTDLAWVRRRLKSKGFEWNESPS